MKKNYSISRGTNKKEIYIDQCKIRTWKVIKEPIKICQSCKINRFYISSESEEYLNGEDMTVKPMVAHH
jgi:hypothetical protein